MIQAVHMINVAHKLIDNIRYYNIASIFNQDCIVGSHDFFIFIF